MISTAANLSILRAALALDFAPLTENDRGAFEGAQADALIAWGGVPLANAVCEFTGWNVLVEGEKCIPVIVSGSRGEIHVMDPDGDCYAVTFDMGFGA